MRKVGGGLTSEGGTLSLSVRFLFRHREMTTVLTCRVVWGLNEFIFAHVVGLVPGSQ